MNSILYVQFSQGEARFDTENLDNGAETFLRNSIRSIVVLIESYIPINYKDRQKENCQRRLGKTK